jgi:two-component system, NtrC family, nitrogen regulation sensor histidine kinase GlnL
MMMADTTFPTTLPNRVLENLSNAVLLFDADFRLRYINPAAEMLFGGSARQLAGLPLTELLHSREALLPALQEALQSGHPFSKHEHIFELLNGQEITADISVTILHEHAGRPEILLELKPMDRIIRISRDENLVSQQVATRELLRGLAHEIKNPLGGLRGAAQLLEKQLHDEDLKEYTRVIIDEADRLQKLVNRLLGPSGMPKMRPVNIHEVLEYVRNIVTSSEQQDIRIHRDYDPSIPDITGDPDLLIQAVLNIVNNARQALGERGNIILRTRIMRKFTIGQQQHRLVLSIEIIDDGPGVPAEIRDKIFYPMITGRAEGTGLGLSIAQRLVQQHGGIIECDSAPGKTVFTIYLPI